VRWRPKGPAVCVLVVYASRHGATKGIAERIAETMQGAGLEVQVRPANDARDLTAHNAFVIGSAVYNFHWMKEALSFLRRNQSLLAGRPVWLFSSGPLGSETTDAEGRDLRVVSPPDNVPPMFKRAAKELAQLQEAVKARDHHVFFGAFHRGQPKGFSERLVALMPAARGAFPEGDFRDWADIDNWAEGIARELA